MPPFRRRRPDPPDSREDAVPDDEVAAAMQRWAQAFVDDTAAEGAPFTWDAAEVSRLDELCGVLRSNPDPEFRHVVVMTVGAYLGELLVRHGGGRWTYDPRERAAVVEMPNGLRGYPHNKVARCLDYGRTHSLLDFYWYSTTRELPPDAKLRPLVQRRRAGRQRWMAVRRRPEDVGDGPSAD